MRVTEGDVIGTKDGRYGKVKEVISQKEILVDEFENPADPMYAPSEFWTNADNIASVV